MNDRHSTCQILPVKTTGEPGDDKVISAVYRLQTSIKSEVVDVDRKYIKATSRRWQDELPIGAPKNRETVPGSETFTG